MHPKIACLVFRDGITCLLHREFKELSINPRFFVEPVTGQPSSTVEEIFVRCKRQMKLFSNFFLPSLARFLFSSEPRSANISSPGEPAIFGCPFDRGSYYRENHEGRKRQMKLFSHFVPSQKNGFSALGFPGRLAPYLLHVNYYSGANRSCKRQMGIFSIICRPTTA